MSDTSDRASAFSLVWIIALIIAGLIATCAWEFFVRGVSPVIFGDPVREPYGFAKIVAGLFGADQVSNVVPWPDSLVAALASRFDLPISGSIEDALMRFEIVGEVFVITPAVAVHLFAGVIAFPLVYMLIIRPILFFLPSIILGPIYGAALFAFATYALLHLVLGGPAFLNWSDLAIASLVGHVIYGLFLGVFVSLIAGR